MRKYLAWAESEEDNELWYLIDAESEEHARRVLLEEEKDIREIRACKEVEPNDEQGVSHKFTLRDFD